MMCRFAFERGVALPRSRACSRYSALVRARTRVGWIVLPLGLLLLGTTDARAQATSQDSLAATASTATDSTLNAALVDSAGASAAPSPDQTPITDRWRDIPVPPYELNVPRHWYDPYNRNRLKGDDPIIGQNTFLVLTGTTTTLVEGASNFTPSGVSTARPASEEFFGRGDRFVLNEYLKLTLEFYHGDTAFRPRDWELRATPVFNLNYANTREFNGTNINVRRGDNRTDAHLGFQELFFDKHLFDVSDRYDFVSFRGGIQRFASDFRGLVFSDHNLGGRLFGNLRNNRWQYNLAFFHMLEKDTNSELNTFEARDQEVAIANLYRQDTFVLGYTTQISFHYNLDRESEQFDTNGFPVRPAVLGNTRPHQVEAYYIGWTGDGHFGRLNIDHAFYQVLGEDSFNSLANRRITLNAQMAALELSIDKDWMRFKTQAFYSSADSEPEDSQGRGFDTILDAPVFAGGPLSYWNSQAIKLQGVNLVGKESLVPSLRSSKTEGQANFVNPGLFLAGVGYDADLTPKVRLAANVNYLRFVDMTPLEVFVNQSNLDHNIGLDYGLGLVYRPFLNNNVSATLVANALSPLGAIDEIYESPGTQYSVLTSLTFRY